MFYGMYNSLESYSRVSRRCLEGLGGFGVTTNKVWICVTCTYMYKATREQVSIVSSIGYLTSYYRSQAIKLLKQEQQELQRRRSVNLTPERSADPKPSTLNP